MSLLEIDIEDAVCKWAEEHGWLAPKLQWLNQTGWPDRTFLKNGLTIWIEFKKPGGVTSKKQLYWARKIREHGGIHYFCDDIETGIAILSHHG